MSPITALGHWDIFFRPEERVPPTGPPTPLPAASGLPSRDQPGPSKEHEHCESSQFPALLTFPSEKDLRQVKQTNQDRPCLASEAGQQWDAINHCLQILYFQLYFTGKPIIENITDATRKSRKTICVISRRYQGIKSTDEVLTCCTLYNHWDYYYLKLLVIYEHL